MEPQEILAAFNEWKTIHQAIHGELSREEHELVNEAADFLINVAQARKKQEV
jgi:hypothetical protein